MRRIAVPVAVLVGLFLGSPDAAAEDPGLAVDPTGPFSDLVAEHGAISEQEFRFGVACPTLMLASVGLGYSFAPSEPIRLVTDLSAGLTGAQLAVGARLAFGSGRHTFLLGADIGVWHRWPTSAGIPGPYPFFVGIVRLQALGWEVRLSRHGGFFVDAGVVLSLRGNLNSNAGSSDCSGSGDDDCGTGVFPAAMPEIRAGFLFSM
jgi:hypothetical protein